MSYFSDPAVGCRHSKGRPGQSRTMVPEGATMLTICSQRGGSRNGPMQTRTVTATFASVESLLNASPHQAAHYRCDAGGLARTYTLEFAYDSGPGVAVDVTPDCQPGVTNGNVHADTTDRLVAAIDRLIGLR